MIDFLAGWLQSIWMVLVESGPYLLLGFVIAGVIKALIPQERIERHLGHENLKSVMWATLIGAPLPLCSCSVIPTAIALRKKGASKGATTAFLISTPETGVDSIGVTWALMDPIMTIARPLAAVVTAFAAGALVNLMIRLGIDRPGTAVDEPASAPAAGDSCCAVAPAPSIEQPPADPYGHAHDHADHDHGRAPAQRRTALGVLKEAVAYAFGPLMADLTPWLILGFVLAGLISQLVPENFFGSVVPQGWPSMLLMLGIGVPLYICATASTPVAAALVAKGLEPGAALVFLLAGPATNIATVLVVSRFLGLPALAAYVGSIAVCALAFGVALDRVYAALDVDLARATAQAGTMDMGWFATACALAIIVMLIVHARRLRLRAQAEAFCVRAGLARSPAGVRGIVALIIVLAWGTTAYTLVGPGSTGFVTRFGAVVEKVDEPSLVWHLPWPLAKTEVVARDAVRRITVGEREDAPSAPFSTLTREAEQALQDEAESITGDEKLLSITYSLHWRARDAYRLRYGIAEPEPLVKAFGEAAIRRMAASRAADETQVTQWQAREAEAKGFLQADLDRIGSGIEVTGVNLLYVHVVPRVHFAYRDVASAYEDKLKEIRRAEGDRATRIPLARGEAHRIEQDAAADAELAVAAAQGEVASFLALLEPWRAHKDEVRARLVQDAVKRAWTGARLIAPLSRFVDVVLTGAGASGASGAQRAALPDTLLPPVQPASPARPIPPLSGDEEDN